MTKSTCDLCKKKCRKGSEVIKLRDKIYHPECFVCQKCRKPLRNQQFYQHEGQNYCAEDYKSNFAPRCPICNQSLEGDVIRALGSNFHKTCFYCSRCRHQFEPGESVHKLANEFLCDKCFANDSQPSLSPQASKTDPELQSQKPQHTTPTKSAADGEPSRASLTPSQKAAPASPTTPVSVQDRVEGGKSSTPLNAQLHIYTSDTLGSSRGNTLPLNVSNVYGPGVLKAYGQGGTLASARSFPRSGTNTLSGTGTNTLSGSPYAADGTAGTQGPAMFSYLRREAELERDRKDFAEKHGIPINAPPPALARFTFPYSLVPMDGPSTYEKTADRPDKAHTLKEELTFQEKAKTLDERNKYRRTGTLTSTLGGHGKANPNFLRPSEDFSYRTAKNTSMPNIKKEHIQFLSMLVLSKLNPSQVERTFRSPRSRSPARNAEYEEAVRSSRVPHGQPDDPRPVPIERDDFPAPIASAVVLADKLREKRRSAETLNRSNGDRDVTDGSTTPEQRRLAVSIEELNKAAQTSGIAAILYRDLVSKLRVQRDHSPSLDPVSSSRAPNAAFEPSFKTRYESPMFASPSRVVSDDRGSEPQQVIRASQPASRAATLPPGMYSVGSRTSYPYNDLMGERNLFSLRTSAPDGSLLTTANYQTLDASQLSSQYPTLNGSSAESPRDALTTGYVPHFTSTFSAAAQSSPNGRVDSSDGALEDNDELDTKLSYPNVITYPAMFGMRRTKDQPAPPKIIYSYEQLKNLNTLPKGVNKQRLEDYLSDEEFLQVFEMSRQIFAKLPSFKREDLKRKKGLL